MRIRTHTALAVLTLLVAATWPSAAHADPGDRVVTAGDERVTASCTFSAKYTYYNRRTNQYVLRAKVTIKATEIRPSAFSPSQVAQIGTSCVIGRLDHPEDNFGPGAETRGTSLYRTRYITMPAADIGVGYEVCTLMSYMLPSGASFYLSTCDPV